MSRLAPADSALPQTVDAASNAQAAGWAWGDVLDAIPTNGEAERTHCQSALAEFSRLVADRDWLLSRDAKRTVTLWINQIDELLSAQLNEIMHHPDFQRLEASWRGVRYLVELAETGPLVRIRLLNASKKDLMRDMERALEFDQSALFKAVYEEEYGTFGGDPYGALIGDYDFGKHPDDIALLERISNVAAAAHAPFIAAAAPSMFDRESFAEVFDRQSLEGMFRGPEYAQWRSFRESADSRYAGLTLPRVLMREPYTLARNPIAAFRFEEDVDGPDASRYLWGNAAYAFGLRLISAFEKYSWLAQIRGSEGGLVDGLPALSFSTEHGDLAQRGPTETIVTDTRERELADLGFIPLVHCKDTGLAAFFTAQSCQKPALYSEESANANARLSAMLPYIFCTSRMAHYIKVLARDKIGTFITAEDCQRFLNDWMRKYTLDNPEGAGIEIQAQSPFRKAEIIVSNAPGKPGSFEAQLFLLPHFQLEQLTVAVKLVTRLQQQPQA